MVRDVLHLRAPGNWMNDPNGFIYFQGKYHLFYQYFPYGPMWGTMHWGHAVSEDLVRWEHGDIALFPTKGYDRNGVFSGSALEKNGKLYLYYSAVRYLEEDMENIHHAPHDCYETSQAVLVSENGMQFDNWKGKNQIIPVCREEETANAVHTRDPKVWEENGVYYMVLGSTYREEIGRAVFYRSGNGMDWEYMNQLRDRQFGRILECPDIFPVGEDYIFLGSPMYVAADEMGYRHHAVCARAGFDGETCRLILLSECRYVDYGLDLYAVQTNVDEAGRRVMLAWMRMPEAVKASDRKTWIGMMCQPRVIDLEDGHIYFRVHPNVEKYFGKETSEKYNMPGMPCRIRTVLAKGESLNVGGYRIWEEEDAVWTDRSGVFAGITDHKLVSITPKLAGRYELDIFVSPNLIEIFVNDGQYVISSVVYGLGDELTGEIETMYLPEEE